MPKLCRALQYFGHAQHPLLVERPAHDLQAERQPVGSRPGRDGERGNAGEVKMSFRYIATGSSFFSPTGKAAEGAVGARMQSTFSNAVAKSRMTNVRTRCAFK